MLQRFFMILALAAATSSAWADPSTFFQAAQAATPVSAKDLTIQNARVEVGNGTVIENATIVIRNGRIVSVESNSTAATTGERFDAAGLTIYPGFVDGYTSRGLKLPTQADDPAPPDPSAVAKATMREDQRKGIRPELRASTCLDFNESVTKEWFEYGFMGGMVSPGSGSIRGTGCIVAANAPGTAPSVLRDAFALEMTCSSRFDRSYPGSLMGVTAWLRQFFADAKRYSSMKAAANAGKLPDFKPDPAYDAMQPALIGAMPTWYLANTEGEIYRSGIFAAEFNIHPTIVGARDAYLVADKLKASRTPLVISLGYGSEPDMSEKAIQDAEKEGTPKAVLNDRRDTWIEKARNAQVLASTGVPIAFTSMGTTADEFWTSLRNSIKLGLPRERALEFLTIGAAKMLGVDADLGTVQPGRIANLLVMDGDFASPKTKIVAVIAGGVKVAMKADQEVSR